MLELIGLKKRFPGFDLDISLKLDRGQIGVVLGPSGSGKSTLLRLIAGLIRQDSGSVRVEGELLDNLAPEKRRLGMVFQDLALFSHLSVRRNIEYGLRLRGLAAPERASIVTALASSFGIADLLERSTDSLSGGERQRTALARTLAPGPRLVLLDEPLSSLDVELRRRLREEIAAGLRASGLTALHVTHDIEEAFAIADRIFLMAEGRIQEEGSAEELFSRPRTAFAARFLGSGPLIPVEALDSDAFGPLARTALGSFHCTLPAGSSRAPEGDLLLHFGSAAAGILPLSSGSEPARENQVRVRVLNAVFAGRFRRVTFEYRSKGSPQGTGILELEFPVDCRCEVGEQLLLEVPPEHCSLLPAVFPREGPRRGDAA